MPEGPPSQHRDDHAPTIARNARYGLILFAVYLALYGGFMALSAFAPQRMARPALGGVNLAVIYGFVLIIAALALALVYMVLCRPAARDTPDERVAAAQVAEAQADADTQPEREAHP